MRVAVIGAPWVPVPPPAYGGTEVVLDHLVRALVHEDIDVAYAGHEDSDLPAELLSPLDKRDIGAMGQTASELAHVAMAYELAERWHADVIHDNTLVGPLVGRPVAPLVVTSHGPFDALTTPIFERVARRAAIVAISHAQAASAPSIPVKAVIHHGLDVADWPFGDGHGDYVLFLGRMHPDKGAHRAIDIAREAGVPLVIAAKMREPAELAFFDAEVRPRLHADAHFVGEVDAILKRALLAGARALLNPIGWPEPFGMVMIESLACGTPVIASPLGAAPEIVDHGRTGFLCDTTADTVAAIDAVGRLERASCRAAVAQHFPVEKMVRGYLDVYYGVLPSSPLVRTISSAAHPTASTLHPSGRALTEVPWAPMATPTR